MQSDEITISCYENEVPSFVETEMENLYGNIFSSLLQFRISGKDAERASTYAAYRARKMVAVFLFLQAGGKVRVMNEAIRIDSEQLSLFASHIFASCPMINVISFKGIETDIERLAFPYQRYNHLEDFVLALPGNVDDYAASLGKNTRRNLKRYLKKLKHNHPSCRFICCEKKDIKPQQIREIIELNRARMAARNIVSEIDEDETVRIIDIIAECGLVGMITVDDRICAGTISYRQGNNYFLNVLAHRSEYDDYALGFLCCYLTICECIARKGNEFHFLWGRYDYKLSLGAYPRYLDNVVIYRSYGQLLRNIDEAWRTVRDGYIRKARLWAQHDANPASKLLRALVPCFRRLKGSIREPFAERLKILKGKI